MKTLRQLGASTLGRVVRKLNLRKLLAATTPSAPSASVTPRDRYISREGAAARYGGTADDIFQGDIFRSVELLVPQPSGAWRDPVSSPAIVVANDCEWTKYEANGAPDYKFGVAPLRKLASFEDENKPGLLNIIEDNKVRYLFPLPHEDPLDDKYVVDLRLIQPITVAELLGLREDLWTSIGNGLKEPLQGKITVFYTNRELVKDEDA
jgi:hypothetical protein